MPEKNFPSFSLFPSSDFGNALPRNKSGMYTRDGKVERKCETSKSEPYCVRCDHISCWVDGERAQKHSRTTYNYSIGGFPVINS